MGGSREGGKEGGEGGIGFGTTASQGSEYLSIKLFFWFTRK